MRSFAVSVLVLCLSALPVQAEPSWKAVDDAIQPLVEQRQLAGAVLLIMHDGKRVHESALGMRDLASNAPMTVDTIFRAFSMTKPVTAVAMMILWDEGKWHPDDPITKFLPELLNVKVFKGLDSSGNPILEAPRAMPTMTQLLTHTAGFSYGFTQSYVDDLYRKHPPGAANSADEFVKKLAALPLAYEPGTQWQYSVSMDVEGAIIERISGEKFATFVERHVLAPLKMKDSGFFVPAEKRKRLATLYTWNKDHLETTGGATDGFETEPGFASGGGGLVTTARDYARIGQMLLNHGTLDGVRVLSAAAAQAIMTDHLAPALVTGGYGIGFQHLRPGYQYGYNGVVVTDPTAAQVALGRGSYLWDGAAGTWFWVDPENQLVFIGMIQRIMSSGGMPQVQDMTQRAVRATLASSSSAPLSK